MKLQKIKLNDFLTVIKSLINVKNAFYFLNALLLISFFLSIKFLSYSIGIYLIVSIFFSLKKKIYISKQSLSLTNTYFFLFPVIVLLVSMIWTENQTEGWNQILKKAPLISLPFCMWVQTHFIDKNFTLKIINSWIFLSSVFSLYGLSMIFFAYEIDYFSELTFIHIRHLLHIEILKMHPVYIGLTNGISSIIIFHKLLQKNTSRKGLYTVALLLNITILLLISARMPILTTLICFIFLFKVNKKAKALFVIFCFTFLFFVSPKVFPGYRFNEISKLIRNIDSTEIHTKNTLQTRQMIYSCSIKLIAGKPILGYGIGDNIDLIQNCQTMKGQKGSFNSHNQYLEYMLSAGVFGLIFFILYLIIIIKNLLKMKSQIGLVLLTFFMLNMITENIFARTWGVFLFSFILYCLYFESERMYRNTINPFNIKA